VETFEDRIQNYRHIINEKLNQVVNKTVPVSFYEPVQYLLEGGGKRIRPILVIMACRSVGGEIADCLDAAVAIELLHNFTLAHDDIMDHDDLRRGKVTVHKKWDEATAILAGDGLVALAYHYLLQTKSNDIRELCKIFTDGIIQLCEGQALDKEFENQFDIDLPQYISMIEKKTARLLMISMEIGAIIGSGNLAERHLLREFALELGCAFQIQDDFLDIAETSGKTFASDILQKKKTFLFVHAFNHATKLDKKLIKKIFSQPNVSQNDIGTVKNIFQKAGTLACAQQEVKMRLNKAEKLAAQLNPSPAKDDLFQFLNLILNRNS
jgi:geranylgeranyl diphosphate synthase type II